MCWSKSQKNDKNSVWGARHPGQISQIKFPTSDPSPDVLEMEMEMDSHRHGSMHLLLTLSQF